MALDERYITSVELQSYFVDKDSGLPLAGGLVYFYSDNNRNQLKDVYQLSGSPPNYTYSVLPNPLTLSGVGTFQDNTGNDIAVYYFPYDAFGNVENYFIEVYSASELPPGQPQFTREAWPNKIDDGSTTAGISIGGFANMLSNSQFVEVLFDTNNTFSITYVAGLNEVEIAPDWTLVINASAGGSLTVARNSIAGSTKRLTNPPYSLLVTPGSNINTLQLRQRLTHNPNIWSATVPNGNGFVEGGFALAPGAPLVTMQYVPSTGTPTTIFSSANALGTWAYVRGIRQLPEGDNTDDSNDGYVDIILSLNTGSPTEISSVQLVGLDSDVDEDGNPLPAIPYEQEPVNRQIDHLFHYYKPQLEYKPIPSYLVGWDFPLNPAQFEGRTVAATAIGANRSKYVWDQTIIFQSVDSGVGVTGATNGGITLTQAVTGQMAIIQYLEGSQVLEILSQRTSVALSGLTNVVGGVTGTVSLWVTDDPQLPNVASATNNSIVLTLDANGKPATRNGNWTEIPRSGLNSAQFTLGTTTTEAMLSGFELTGSALSTTATYFAIVIGFESITSPGTVTLNWVSLNGGDIATRPAPQSFDQVLSQCEYFYEKSYANDEYAADTTDENSIIKAQNAYLEAGVAYRMVAQSFSIEFKSLKRTDIPNVILYNPTNGTLNQVLGTVFGAGSAAQGTGNLATTLWTANTNTKSVYYQLGTYNESVTEGSFAGGGWASGAIRLHYVADARLGIVL